MEVSVLVIISEIIFDDESGLGKSGSFSLCPSILCYSIVSPDGSFTSLSQ